jgi:serine/threonine protein kinase
LEAARGGLSLDGVMNKARYGKDGKLKSSLVTKAAEAAFERYEEAWFNFHRYDKDGNGVIDVKELISLLSDMKMHVGRANRSEEQMALFVSREIKKNDLNGDGVLNFEEFLTYYNKFVARHRSQCDEIYEVVEGKELGRGAFGVVVLGRRLENGQEVAMKRLVKAEVSQSESALELLHNEIAVWESLSHPNLLTLLDVFEEPECLILVTEMMRGGDLFQRLRSTPESRFAEAVAARLSYQVLAAVAYLHSNNIVHCDLKPNNVLIAEAVGECELSEITVRIADFGLSQTIRSAAVAHGSSELDASDPIGGEGEGGGGEGEGGGGNADGGNEDAGNGAGDGDGDGTGAATASTDAGPGSRGVPSPPPRRPSTLSMVCGTPTYFAPELVRLAQQHIGAPEYGPAVDNWAVGCIVYELLTGDPPFLASDEQILFYKILETTPDMPSNVSPLAAELILALMRKEPEERLTCAPAMKYRWLEAGWS